MAGSFYFSPDVPIDAPSSPGTLFRPWDIVRNDDAGPQSAVGSLPDSAAIDAMHRTNDGSWLLSFEAAVELPEGSGTVYKPGDVVLWDGVAYQLYFDVGSEGLPAGANVDAVFLKGGDAGTLVLSFDAPVTLGGVTYDPADLVTFSGGAFGLEFDASATTPPIPASTNVTAADEKHGSVILSFDRPTTLGATTFLPGQLVSWNPGTGAFSTEHDDPAWKLSARLDATAYLASPGRIGSSLRVEKSAATTGDLLLSWGPSCSTGAEDFGIYEGSLENIYSHVPIACADAAGDMQEEIAPASGNRYYLVVPWNSNDEGSYGMDSDGLERPTAGASSCVATQEIEPCP